MVLQTADLHSRLEAHISVRIDLVAAAAGCMRLMRVDFYRKAEAWRGVGPGGKMQRVLIDGPTRNWQPFGHRGHSGS